MFRMKKDDSSNGISVYGTRKSLLLRLKEGENEESWREFHSIYGRLIFGYSLHFNISYSEAEDIVQEVCIKVFRQILVFDYSPERGRFRGWLKTITRNTVIDYLRRKQRRQKVSLEFRQHVELQMEAEKAIDDELWQQEWEKALYETALSRVRQRVDEDTFGIFNLFVIEQLPAKAVAQRMCIEPNAVYACKHRILKYIRQEIEDIRNNA